MPEFVVDTFSTVNGPAVVTIDYDELSDEQLLNLSDPEALRVYAERHREEES